MMESQFLKSQMGVVGQETTRKIVALKFLVLEISDEVVTNRKFTRRNIYRIVLHSVYTPNDLISTPGVRCILTKYCTLNEHCRYLNCITNINKMGFDSILIFYIKKFLDFYWSKLKYITWSVIFFFLFNKRSYWISFINI